MILLSRLLHGVSISTRTTRRTLISNVATASSLSSNYYSSQEYHLIKDRMNAKLESTNTKTSSFTTETIPSASFATADICDIHIKSPQRLCIAEPCIFQSYGKKTCFHGQIETIRCFESNPLVKETVGSSGRNNDGKGKVLVVDGGGSKRCAILGDMLASMAVENGWAGLVLNGCIRDSKIINTLDIGVKALGTHPLKSIKDYRGEKGGRVAFAGVEFVPGQWLYSDEDGIIISDTELDLSSSS